MRIVCVMPSLCCGGSPKGRVVVDFSLPVKPPAQREREGRCQYSSPRGFHCGTSVASVTSGCLLHSCGASKRRSGPDHEIYCFPPWWQCPAQVHRDLSVPWVLSIDCLQWTQLLPSHWNRHFEYSKFVEINFITLLNLVNWLWWRKGNQFLFTPCSSIPVWCEVQNPRVTRPWGPCLRRPGSPAGGLGGRGLPGRDQGYIPGAAVPSAVPRTNPLEIKICYKVIYNLLLIPDRESIFFNSHNVSKPESSSVLTAVSTLGLFSSSAAGKLFSPFLSKCHQLVTLLHELSASVLQAEVCLVQGTSMTVSPSGFPYRALVRKHWCSRAVLLARPKLPRANLGKGGRRRFWMQIPGLFLSRELNKHKSSF